jgi:Glycosyltransferase family 87
VALWLSRRGGLRFGVVAVLAVAIQLAPLAAPLLLSTDAWTYWDYGRLAAVHGANPYRDTPQDFPDDPAFPYVGEAWRDNTSVYGPAFTLASEPLALAAGDSADAAAWLYKGIAAAAVLGAAWLAARLSPRPVFALAFVAWNPLLALHFAGGGHNDAWMAVLVVGALWLAAAGWRNWAGAAWAGAVLVKWIPIVFLVLRALEARGRRRVGHVGFAAAAAVLAALATWRYGASWLGAFGPLARNANDETSYALPHRLSALGAPRWLALAFAAVAFVVGYAWLARRALAGRARLGLAAVLVLLVTPYLAPWYAVWAVPLAAAEDDRDAQLLSLGLCAYLLPQTVPV